MSTTAQTSSTTSSSTLRPRAKRLISGLSEGDETDPQNFDSPPRRIQSPAPSPFDSRSASPIPAAHPQRSAGRLSGDGADRFAGNSWGRRSQVGRERREVTSPTSLGALWGNSWSTLQGLASDFLGNDLTDEPQNRKGGKSKQRRPLGNHHTHNRVLSKSGPSEWGPAIAPTSHPITSDIGSGTREERENALRAQKRKDMLTRADSSYADALGKFKRRLSDDHESMSAPPAEDGDRAAMVYVHHVQKDDTLAGITIKYNCAAAVIRKANRMWPNDTVQSRQTIVLPVDSCGVKGKPCAGPEVPSAIDLLESPDMFEAEEVPTPKATQPPQNTILTNGNAVAANNLTSQRGRAPSLTTSTTDTSRRASSSTADPGEPPYHHDSWVLLPGFPSPTEIARLSRRALGYFPPARRKSLNLTDLDTPSASLDLGRRTSDHTSTSPAKPNPSDRPPARSRRLSNAGTGYFPSYLLGPGGVGTMSTKVRHPGPAQDGLNALFAKHLPDVAPPKFQSELHPPPETSMGLYHDDTGSGAGTPSLLPSHQGGSAAGSGLGLENFGGAIEGWVRKWTKGMMSPGEYAAFVAQQKQKQRGQAAKAAGQKARVVGPRTSVGAPGAGVGGVGDLIEMTDEFELGTDTEEEEEGRGRGGGAGFLGQESAGGSGSGASFFGGAGGVKGRTVGASVKGKSGKGD